MTRFSNIIGENGLLKDSNSGAIVNSDKDAFQHAQRQRELVLTQIEYQRKVDMLERQLQMVCERLSILENKRDKNEIINCIVK